LYAINAIFSEEKQLEHAANKSLPPAEILYPWPQISPSGLSLSLKRPLVPGGQLIQILIGPQYLTWFCGLSQCLLVESQSMLLNKDQVCSLINH